MTVNIILDTNIIITHPKILGLKVPETHFVIPSEIIQELKTRSHLRGAIFNKLIELIEKAKEEGTVSVIDSEVPKFKQLSKILSSGNFSTSDIAMLALALDYKRNGQLVYIASRDGEIVRYAQVNGITIVADKEIAKLVSEFGAKKNETSNALKDEIVLYEKIERKTFIYGILVGGIATVIVFILFSNLKKIAATFNVWGTIMSILVLGICLFIFREKKRLSYGVAEFLVGAFAIIILFQPNHFEYSKVNFNFEFNLKIVAGLYIMVRGQDNIVKAIKDTKFGLYLKDKYKIGA